MWRPPRPEGEASCHPKSTRIDRPKAPGARTSRPQPRRKVPGARISRRKVPGARSHPAGLCCTVRLDSPERAWLPPRWPAPSLPPRRRPRPRRRGPIPARRPACLIRQSRSSCTSVISGPARWTCSPARPRPGFATLAWRPGLCTPSADRIRRALRCIHCRASRPPGTSGGRLGRCCPGPARRTIRRIPRPPDPLCLAGRRVRPGTRPTTSL